MARFKSRKDRVHHALRLYHGIGTEGEEWSREEIADYLDVKRKVVDGYLDDTPQAREVKQAFDSLGEQTRRELIMEKRDRLRSLREMEEELKEAVEVVVTDFQFKDVELEVTGAPGKGVTAYDDDDPTTYMGKVPVPNKVRQVPQFKRLQEVWEEMRHTEEQLTRLMGLSEPEEIEVGGEVTQRKFYKIEEDDEADFPDQEVKDLSEEDSI